MIYLVVAYRWGFTNEHQYYVYCGTDETKAIALAKVEVDDRGGKYDCAMYVPNDDGTEMRLHRYFAARGGDQVRPLHNWHAEELEYLGYALENYCEGYVHVPDPKDPANLVRHPVTPEPLLVADAQRIKKMWRLMQEKSNEIDAALAKQGEASK